MAVKEKKERKVRIKAQIYNTQEGSHTSWGRWSRVWIKYPENIFGKVKGRQPYIIRSQVKQWEG